MRRFWVMVLWVLGLWCSGCSRSLPVEGFPFFDPAGKQISLFVASPGIREGTFQLEKGKTLEVKFSPPLQVVAGSNTVRLQIAEYRGRIRMEFRGSKTQYPLELPPALSEGGYFTFEIPPSKYEGFRLSGQEGKGPPHVVFQEGRVGSFPLHTRFEGGRFVEITPSFIPETMDRGATIFRLSSGNEPIPPGGVRFQVLNKEPASSSPIRTTFFGSGKERRTVTIRTRPIPEDVIVYDTWLGFTPVRIQVEGLDKGVVLTAGMFHLSPGSRGGAKPNQNPVPGSFTVPPKGALTGSGTTLNAVSPALPTPSSLSPLPADLETILSFPQDGWRTKEVEVFRWSLFPEILIFDTKDYTIQKELFHRLAFYLEKKGYRGKLHPDQKIWDLHGWNAHNYRGEGLSAFFNEAERTQFPLNPKERWLADYLLTFGILRRENGKYTAGRGGILSISRESSDPHRRLLLTHEAFHGVYYVSKSFQDLVSTLWKELSPEERKFWLYILSWMQYDPSDPYLVVNEFQAYLLQQPPTLVDRYFKETLPQRILEKNPEMEGFFKEVFEKHPDMFVKPALRLQEFLKKNFGISSSTLTTLRP